MFPNETFEITIFDTNKCIALDIGHTQAYKVDSVICISLKKNRIYIIFHKRFHAQFVIVK